MRALRDLAETLGLVGASCAFVVAVLWVLCELQPGDRMAEFWKHLAEAHGSTAECAERLLRRTHRIETLLAT